MNFSTLFSGYKVITDTTMIEPYEDWSGVRSHSRAKRRIKHHRQNIQIRYRPAQNVLKLRIRGEDCMVMHPDILKQMLESEMVECRG